MTSRIAALTIVAFAVFAPAALAAPSSQITSPADPAYSFYGALGPATAVGDAVQVNGTATDFPGTVDLRCYAPGGFLWDLGDDIAVSGGHFATTADLTVPASSCILRAIPHGTSPSPADRSAFAGPRVLPTAGGTDNAGSTTVEYFYNFPGTQGIFYPYEPSEFGVSTATLMDPVTLAEAPTSLVSNALGIFKADGGSAPATRSEIEVDGAAAYTPYGVVNQGNGAPHNSLSGLPPISIDSESFNATTGSATIVTSEPIVKCSPDPDWAHNTTDFGTSCTSVVSTGVELRRTLVSSGDGLTLTMHDEWRNTGSQAHSIDVLVDNSFWGNENLPTSGFRFPGDSTFKFDALGAVAPPPPGPGTIFYKADKSDPDTGGGKPQGALSYSVAPDTLRFTNSAHPSGGYPELTMHYARAIPAHGSFPVSFQLAQATGQPQLQTFANAFEAQFQPVPQTQTQTQTQTQNSVPQVAAAGLKRGKAKTSWSGSRIVVDTGEIGTCTAGAGSCTFDVAATIASRDAKAARAKRVTIGKATVKVAAGKSKHLTLKLSKRWTKLLVHKKRLKIVVLVTLKSQATSSKASSRTITVKAPKRRKH